MDKESPQIGPSNLNVPSIPSMLNDITIRESLVSPRNVQQRMLTFAAIQGVKPHISRFAMERQGTEEAFRVSKNRKMGVSWSIGRTRRQNGLLLDYRAEAAEKFIQIGHSSH